MQPLICLSSFLIGVRFAKSKAWDLVTLLEINVTFRKRQTALKKNVLSVSQRPQLCVIAVLLSVL